MKLESWVGNMFGLLLNKLDFLHNKNILLAKFLVSLPESVAQFVTLDEDGSPLAKWYHKNGIFKYAIDTPIALTCVRNFGYGIRPVGVVKGYTDEGGYIVEMEADIDGNFFDWMNGRYTPSGNRSKKIERHFKWNVEYQFREIPKADVDFAYS